MTDKDRLKKILVACDQLEHNQGNFPAEDRLKSLFEFIRSLHKETEPEGSELVRQEQRHRSRTQAQMRHHLEAQFYGD